MEFFFESLTSSVLFAADIVPSSRAFKVSNTSPPARTSDLDSVADEAVNVILGVPGRSITYVSEDAWPLIPMPHQVLYGHIQNSSLVSAQTNSQRPVRLQRLSKSRPLCSQDIQRPPRFKMET